MQIYSIYPTYLEVMFKDEVNIEIWSSTEVKQFFKTETRTGPSLLNLKGFCPSSQNMLLILAWIKNNFIQMIKSKILQPKICLVLLIENQIKVYF